MAPVAVPLNRVRLRTHSTEVVYRMKRLILSSVLLLSSGVVALTAQGPAGRRPGPGPIPGPGAMRRDGSGGAVDNPAAFLLSQTGELRLTDAQVTRLAAIARRSAERRQSLRTQMDSLRPIRPRGQRPDSAARAQMRQRMEQMRPAMTRLKDQSLADRRDAIALLTPDQQVQAWERIARMGPRGNPDRGRGVGRPGRAGFRDGPTGGPRARMRGPAHAPRRVGPPNEAGAPGERPPGPRPRPEFEG